jgi:hypothetical protein
MSQSSAIPKFIGAQLMRAGPQMSTEPPVIQEEMPTGMPQTPVAEQPQFSRAELEAELLRRQQEQQTTTPQE